MSVNDWQTDNAAATVVGSKNIQEPPVLTDDCHGVKHSHLPNVWERGLRTKYDCTPLVSLSVISYHPNTVIQRCLNSEVDPES